VQRGEGERRKEEEAIFLTASRKKKGKEREKNAALILLYFLLTCRKGKGEGKSPTIRKKRTEASSKILCGGKKGGKRFRCPEGSILRISSPDEGEGERGEKEKRPLSGAFREKTKEKGGNLCGGRGKKKKEPSLFSEEKKEGRSPAGGRESSLQSCSPRGGERGKEKGGGLPFNTFEKKGGKRFSNFILYRGGGEERKKKGGGVSERKTVHNLPSKERGESKPPSRGKEDISYLFIY